MHWRRSKRTQLCTPFISLKLYCQRCNAHLEKSASLLSLQKKCRKEKTRLNCSSVARRAEHFHNIHSQVTSSRSSRTWSLFFALNTCEALEKVIIMVNFNSKSFVIEDVFYLTRRKCHRNYKNKNICVVLSTLLQTKRWLASFFRSLFFLSCHISLLQQYILMSFQ